MDDMTNLEARMTVDAQRVAGPPRAVDAAAVFAAIPTSRWPLWRFQSMFSATKVVVAGVIVALFGGFLLTTLPDESPVTEAPGAATSAATHTPAPAAVQVDIPELGFSIIVPRGWTHELPYRTGGSPEAIVMDSPNAPDVPFTQSCHAAPGPDETRTLEALAAEELAPVPAELVELYGEAVVERADLSLPAGAAVRIDRSFDDAGISIYYLTDGERVLRLECAAERIIDDHWRSIAETLEFLPQPEDASGPGDIGAFRSSAETIASLTTEEVEPGVLRVLDDGIDDGRGIERRIDGFPSMFVDVTPDGRVWLSGGGGTDDLFRLGESGAFEDVGAGPLEIGPDGTFWAHDGDIVRSFSNGVWTSWQLEDDLETRAITVDRNGAPWVLVEEDTIGDESVLTLGQDGEWEQIELPWDLGGVPDWRWMDATPDGALWLSGGEIRGPDRKWTSALVRYDGVDWELIEAPGRDGDVHGLAAGPAGELWRAYVDPDANLDSDLEMPSDDPGADWIGLARLDENGWTAFGATDGVGSWGQRIGLFYGTDLLEVGPHGTVWVNAARHLWDCGGVASFDGKDWTPYLEGRCVHDLAVAPDGGLWVRAYLDGWEGVVGTFVILPRENAGDTGK